jgi:hypothetical protein
VAIALGFLTEEQLTLALREQVRLKVVRCIQWEAPVCGFRSAADEVAEVVHYPCPVEPAVLDGIRRFSMRNGPNDLGDWSPATARRSVNRCPRSPGDSACNRASASCWEPSTG